MNSQDFSQEIETRKPRFLTKFNTLVDAISNKQSMKGGDFIQFGPYFQTYMYAFMIGYQIGCCNVITGSGEAKDFAPISVWRPSVLVDYILMLILSEPEDKLGFKWIQLESADEDQMKQWVSNMVRRIEGYANTGLDYIDQKYNNNKEEFTDPFVFVNLLREVSK
jgi:hypothetical protein